MSGGRGVGDLGGNRKQSSVRHDTEERSVVVPSAAPVLAGEVDLRMDDALAGVSRAAINGDDLDDGLLPCDGSAHRCVRRSSLRHTVRIEPFACAHCESCPHVS